LFIEVLKRLILSPGTIYAQPKYNINNSALNWSIPNPNHWKTIKFALKIYIFADKP